MIKKFLKKNKQRLAIYFIAFFVLFTLVYYFTRAVPDNFPAELTFLVEENESLKSISTRLESENIINSALFFRVWVSAQGKDRHVNVGKYIFNKKLSLGAVVKKMTSTADKPLLKITIPEGSTNQEVAKIVHFAIPEISVNDFLLEIEKQKADGELFPETYFLIPSQNAENLVKLLRETFDKKYNGYVNENEKLVKSTILKMQDIGFTDKNYKEGVLNLAAIIQGEGKYKEDMKIISGILWKRLLTNMALQVDVATETYKRRGLANKIINNPGMDAVEAVFNPTPSEYLYYITGRDGKMYYAKTFTEHKRNIAKYLK